MQEFRRGREDYAVGTCYELTLDGGLIVTAEVLQATADGVAPRPANRLEFGQTVGKMPAQSLPED